MSYQIFERCAIVQTWIKQLINQKTDKIDFLHFIGQYAQEITTRFLSSSSAFVKQQRNKQRKIDINE